VATDFNMARRPFSRIGRSLVSRLVLLWLAVQTAGDGLAAAAQGDPALIPSIFRPESTPAHTINGLSMLVLAITGLIFVAVFGVMVYVLVRYRRRPGDDGEPAQVYGSTQVEIAWTVTPVLIVVVLSLTGARAIDQIQNAPRGPASLDVTAIGHQWWWEFQYPDLGVTTATEMFVPVVAATAFLGETQLGDEMDAILVNRFYLRGLEQIDRRTGERPQPLPGQPLGGISWRDRSR